MDISETLAPTSDQLDAVDLVGGARTFTVTNVSKGSAEQPVQVHLAEFPRVWRPGKSMRRVLAAGWGNDASKWTGRRVELFCDPSVQFGGAAVGGTRISGMSHIDKALKVPLLIKRGKSAVFTVQPLPDEPQQQPEPTEAEVAECTDTDVLREMWQRSGDERRAQIMARKAELEHVDTTTGEVTDEEPPAEEQQ